MQFPNLLFWLLFGGVLAYFVFKALRRGSLRGAFFNASITRTVGEVDAVGPKLLSQRIKVHNLDRDGANFVGVEVVSKTLASYQMLPLVLSNPQARELVSLLQQALGEQRVA